jgi:hypothetical protein
MLDRLPHNERFGAGSFSAGVQGGCLHFGARAEAPGSEPGTL